MKETYYGGTTDPLDGDTCDREQATLQPDFEAMCKLKEEELRKICKMFDDSHEEINGMAKHIDELGTKLYYKEKEIEILLEKINSLQNELLNH